LQRFAQAAARAVAPFLPLAVAVAVADWVAAHSRFFYLLLLVPSGVPFVVLSVSAFQAAPAPRVARVTWRCSPASRSASVTLKLQKPNELRALFGLRFAGNPNSARF
jgi:hypothetical protein